MNIQFLMVTVIGVVAGVIILRKLYKFFFTKKDASFCGGCKACDLSDMQRENKKNYLNNNNGKEPSGHRFSR